MACAITVQQAGAARGRGASGRRRRERRRRIQTELRAAQVLAHYSALLEKRGWQFNAAVNEGAVALRTGIFKDDRGSSWHALLLAAPSAVAAQRVNVTIRLTRLVAEH